MIEKIKITDNEDAPFWYLKNLSTFKNGTEYKFADGVNILVGENGCGKSTLLGLIKKYLMVEYEWCDKGAYNSNIRGVYKKISIFDKEREFFNGVEVFADYDNNTFNLVPFEQRHSGSGFIDADHPIDLGRNLALQFEFNEMSKGQQMNLAIYSLFEKMFSKDAILKFDYEGTYSEYPEYLEYISKHRVDSKRTWTVLMDEPDCSVDIEKLKELYGVLSYNKPHVQLIAAVHNPFLILKLSKVKGVNIIEMSKGYINKIKKQINEFNNL